MSKSPSPSVTHNTSSNSSVSVSPSFQRGYSTLAEIGGASWAITGQHIAWIIIAQVLINVFVFIARPIYFKMMRINPQLRVFQRTWIGCGNPDEPEFPRCPPSRPSHLPACELRSDSDCSEPCLSRREGEEAAQLTTSDWPASDRRLTV